MNFMKSFLCLSLLLLLFLILCPVVFNGLEKVIFFSATAVNQNVEMSDGNNTQKTIKNPNKTKQ